MDREDEIDIADVLAEVQRIEVLSRRLVTDVMSGGYNSVFRGSGVEFSEVREYVDGDDPRSVDWNVTAKLGRPFVKKFVDERQLTLFFVFDLSPSMTGGFSAWSMRKAAALVCACFGLAAMRNNDRVGFVGFSSAVDLHLPPRRGKSHVLRIIREALIAKGKGSESRLDLALEHVARVAPRHSVVFLLSDFLTDGYDDELVRCALRHDVVALQFEPPELEVPDAGFMRMQDPETGRVGLVDWRDATTRRRYQDCVSRWQERTTAAMKRASVDLVHIALPRLPGRQNLTKPLLEFFRMREERGAKR